MPENPADPKTVTALDLFLGFLKIGLLGFGGVATVARHVIVNERQWLTEKGYAEVLGLGQVLPGGNVLNASVMIGERFAGWSGTVASLAGLLLMPLVILISLASLYEHFAASIIVQEATRGSAAAAAGMVIGMALKMTRKLKPTRATLTIGALTFGAVGLLRWPLPAVVLVLTPLAIWAAFRARRLGGEGL